MVTDADGEADVDEEEEADSSEGSTTSGPDVPSITEEEDSGTEESETEETEGPLLPEPVLRYAFDGDLVPDLGDLEAEPIGAVSFEEGPDGQSVRLAGGAHLDLSPFAVELVPELDNMTLGIRYWWSSDEMTPQSLIALGDNGATVADNDFRIQLGSNLSVVTQTGEGDEHLSQLIPAPSTGAWHHLVIVFDDGQVGIHLNGEFVGVTGYTPAETLADELLVGSNACCGHAFEGLLDDLAFFDVPLSQEQATELSSQP